MAHALEFDDTFGRGFLHPSAITFPAAFAVSDLVGGVDGREFLAATTAAIDIACRIAISSQPGVDAFAAGWHNTTVIGYLSTALLAARLMNVNREQAIHAAGIGYHQAAGNAQSHIDGALTKRLGPGLASAAGLFAARLAAKGVTGPSAVLEGKKGWYQQYHHGNYSRALLLDGLGKDFPAVEVSYKPWPSCRGSHTSVDAALQLVRRQGLKPDMVERVLIRNSPSEWAFLSNPIAQKRQPTTTVEG
ncbi:MAG: MmgE/PrpD family protein, partial [Burkholderiales bacterium PBB4]